MLRNPFCKAPAPVKQPGLDSRYYHRVVSMDVDKETLMVTPVYEDVDSVAEIQACKDLCGMEYMKKLLATGQATIEDLQDDAGAVIDLSAIPSNVFEARRLADQANAEVAKFAKAAGCADGEHYSAKQVEEMLTRALAAAFEANGQKPGDGENK